MRRIGVLALQGCVELHRPHIEALGAEMIAVRKGDDLDRIGALILPGGESTTMLKLLETFGLEEKLLETCRRLPVWGICAGAILLARSVTSPSQKSLALLDVEIERNGYGRQLESFQAEVEGYPVSFIRAPVFRRTGAGVESLAEQNGYATWVRQGKLMATSFHPELSSRYPSPWHRRLVDAM